MDELQLRDTISKTLDLLFKNKAVRKTALEPEEVQVGIDEVFPIEKLDPLSLLKEVEDKVIPYINPNTDPSYAAYITGAGHRISVVAELIKAYFNQNSLKWNSSPIGSELEKLVLKWTADFIEAPEFKEGVLTGSGSMSNFLAIHFAMACHFPDREELGIPVNQNPVVYCSTEAHSSIERAMVFLGLGRNRLRKIPVNERFQVALDKLRMMIEEDQLMGDTPFMLIGTAGTTNTGSVDDLEALADIAEELNLWFHVDGAYGLPAVRLKELRKNFSGYERADSITVNQHKWMYVNFEASCILLKDMPEAISFNPSYLQDFENGRWESSRQTIDLSKEFRSLKIWMTFKYLGSSLIANYIRHDIDLVKYFAEKLDKSGFFTVEKEHPLSILCFCVNKDGVSDVSNEELTRKLIMMVEKEGKIFLTGTHLHGKPYLRAYFGNPTRTKEDVDFMVQTLVSSLEKV